MKKAIILSIFSFIFTLNSFGQDCESIIKICQSYLNGQNGKSKFISDGQIYTAFLDREKAEFNTTLFGGTTYRIAVSAGKAEKYAVFTLRDVNGNVLFTNKDHKNEPYWDFKVPKTLQVFIETELDLDKKVTGCVVMMIGFKKI